MTDVSPPPADPVDPAPAPPAARPRGRRRRFVWTWTRRFMALVIAIGTGLFVAFFSINLGRFGQLKELAESQGSKWLERPLHIGEIVAYVRPGHFEVHDVEIEGLRPTDRPFFKAKLVTVDIQWWNIVANHDFTIDVGMNDWSIFIESWGHGRHNLPKLKHPSSGEKKMFTTTLRFMNATNGSFGYDDHSTPWSVNAPNLTFDLVRSMDQYMGTASFHDGTVQIQHFLPMAASLSTRFTLDGSLVKLKHIDLKTDGADTHVAGQVDFAHWPEQRYDIRSQIDFARMRQIFFASENWDVGGKGDFTGIFHVYDGGQELAGDFKSERARVSSLEFPDLHGSLIWFPDRFEVTHADADFYGGRTRFSYAIEPLGSPNPSTQRFTAEVDDASLAALSRLIDLKGLQPVGRVDHAHATMAWPSGKFKSDVQGRMEADLSPPEGVTLAPSVLPKAVAAAVPEVSRILPANTNFDPFKPLGPLATGGHVELGFDGAGLTFDDSWAATSTTYFAFKGRTEYGQDSTLDFHATSLDWQASERLLSAVLTAVGSPTGAVELGGRGTFDGTMTQTFGNPRIAGLFTGENVEAFHVRWGPVKGQAVIANKYVDVTDGVIGDPDGSSIRTTGRFSLGFPRADHGEELRAHVQMTDWPMAELRHAFGLDDWPVDATIGSADVDLFGPFTGLFGSGKMRLVNGNAWKERFDSATGDITLNGTGLSIDRVTMIKGQGRVTGAAVMKWVDGTYSFDAKGENIKVETLDNFKIERAPLTGTLTFTAAGAGAFSAPHYEFGGTITDLYAADELVGDVTGHLILDGKRLTIDQFSTTSFRLQVTGSGQIVMNDQYDAELTLRFLNTSIDPYLKLFAPRMSPYTRAVASGAVRISGPLADYAHLGVFLTGVEGTLSLFDYELKNDGPISLSFQNDTVSIGRFRLRGEGTSLELSGGLSVDQSTIDLRANGDANLAILRGPNMHGSGQAVLHASASGPLDDPSISGYADIQGASFRHLALPRSFTDVTGRVTFDGNAINFDPSDCPEGRSRCGLRGRFGDGDVVFRGTISLKDFMPDELNLSATGTAMRLRQPEGFSSTVNADLTLTGPITAPLLAGTVDVLHATYVKTIDTDLGITALALGAAGGGGGVTNEEAGVEASSEAAFPLSLNIRIRANRTLHIDNRRTATLVGSADLSVRGTLDRPSLTGHIDIESGEVFINGNRFRILPGTIQFANPNRFDPYFDVTAEARPRAQGETFTVGVHLTGSLRGNLNIGLRSEPHLADVDILTLIFGGQPDVGRTELRSFQSQQQAYTTLMQSAAAQFLLSPISSRVGSVFERTTAVDTVQFTTILPTETSFTQLSPSTRVTIGKRLSPRLYMTYSRDLNSSQFEVILVEYEYSDRLSFILSRNEDRTFALDFRVRHVF